jgi:hypothetical protein
VPVDGRGDRVGELEREFAGELGRDDAERARLEVTLELERLRQLRRRIDQRQLEPDDWALLGALIRKTT